MRNLKGPPATSKARSTTSEGAWAVFFSGCRNTYSNLFNISFTVIKKCTNLPTKIRSERVKGIQSGYKDYF